jgi:hypothetical protein
VTRPKKIRLLSNDIPVVWSAAAVNQESRREGEPLYGLYHDGKIIIDPDTHNTKETLLHETLHAIIAQTGLSETGGPLSGDNEEHLVRTLSPLLLHLMRENRGLIQFLIEG